VGEYVAALFFETLHQFLVKGFFIQYILKVKDAQLLLQKNYKSIQLLKII